MLEKNEKILLDSLKENFINQKGKENNVYFGPSDINADKRDYYVKEIKDNCFNGISRNDLKSDSRAIRSSATMIYNTLGNKNDEIIFTNKESYIINDYEEILPGLKSRTGPHLDVTLKTKEKDKIIFIESKCLEWLSTSEKMVNSYLMPANYKYENSNIFIPWFKKFLEFPEEERNEYSSIYKRYNSKQMNIHIFGIYNWCIECIENGQNLPKEINLWNIVWDYSPIEEYQTEEIEGKEYCKKASEYFSKLFKENFGILFVVQYIGYSDFLQKIDWTNKQDRRNYLQRYELKKGLSNSEFLEIYDELWEKTWHYGEPVKEFSNNDLPYFNVTDDKLPDEDWESLSHITGYTDYKVSNLGRVKFKGKIIPQSDERQKGYLRLDPNGKEHVDHQIYVYTLIAIGFLGKRFNDGYDVHHISNNGCDCRVENLKLLTRTQHNAVHCKKESMEYYRNILNN